MRNKLREKVQFIHAEEMFLYCLINIWKKQNWLKKTLSHLTWLAHLHVFISKIFISPRWDPGKIKRYPTYAGWLTSHMNTLYFYRSFLKEGEISPSYSSPSIQASSPPHEQPLNTNCFSLMFPANLATFSQIGLLRNTFGRLLRCFYQ